MIASTWNGLMLQLLLTNSEGFYASKVGNLRVQVLFSIYIS